MVNIICASIVAWNCGLFTFFVVYGLGATWVNRV